MSDFDGPYRTIAGGKHRHQVHAVETTAAHVAAGDADAIGDFIVTRDGYPPQWWKRETFLRVYEAGALDVAAAAVTQPAPTAVDVLTDDFLALLERHELLEQRQARLEQLFDADREVTSAILSTVTAMQTSLMAPIGDSDRRADDAAAEKALLDGTLPDADRREPAATADVADVADAPAKTKAKGGDWKKTPATSAPAASPRPRKR